MKVAKEQRSSEVKYLVTVLLIVVMVSLLILTIRIQRGVLGIMLMVLAALIFFYWFKEVRKLLRKSERKEFIYEVIEEDGSVTVIAQVPGPEWSVKALSLGRKIIIEGGGGFKKTLILRSKVKLVTSIYKNGILTIKLEKL